MSRLGEERRARVLAGLYMARSDGELFVRQAAVHVWKVIVSNTPRTLREIMPVLFSLLLSCLAAEEEEKRKVRLEDLCAAQKLTTNLWLPTSHSALSSAGGRKHAR